MYIKFDTIHIKELHMHTLSEKLCILQYSDHVCKLFFRHEPI
ncbi:hypothetical protein CCP3SC1AL1_2220009 [Gammaproteobacteria bacterium]